MLLLIVVCMQTVKFISVFRNIFNGKHKIRLQNEGAYIFIDGLFVPLHQAILNDVHDAIRWSNVDLKNFQYFKNLPSQDPKRAAQANLFLEHFQKKKAVLDYFENLFLGNSPFTQESEIPFNPHFGTAWRPYYVRKFGWKGERLIDALGKGYPIKQIKHFGAVPKYYPS